jgi:amidase
MIYEHARRMKAASFVGALAGVNTVRRRLARFFVKYDVWLCPTTARVAEPWGIYNLGRTDVTMDDLAEKIFRGTCQFTLPHNILGVPAISLPLAMHPAGLPIGIQLGARPANEHIILQLAAALEEAMPWRGRVPPLHAGRTVD